MPTVFFPFFPPHTFDSQNFPKCAIVIVSSTYSITYISLKELWIPCRFQPKAANLLTKLRLKQQYFWSWHQVLKCPKHTWNGYSFGFPWHSNSFSSKILVLVSPWGFERESMQLSETIVWKVYVFFFVSDLLISENSKSCYQYWFTRNRKLIFVSVITRLSSFTKVSNHFFSSRGMFFLDFPTESSHNRWLDFLVQYLNLKLTCFSTRFLETVDVVLWVGILIVRVST